MASTEPDQDTSLIFFTYRGRKVAVVRPATYAEAISLVLQYFHPLRNIPADSITISAQFPDYQAQGTVEIHPEAWRVALRTVDNFEIGVELNEEPAEAIRIQVNAFRPSPPTVPSRMSAGRTASGRPEYGNMLVLPDGDPSFSEGYGLAGGFSRGRGRGGPPGRGVPILIGKPVIYLYPQSPIEACVKISLVTQWKFSALYPVPAKGAIRDGKFSHSAEWLVSSRPDGMMKVKGTSTEVAYLFWEAEPNTSTTLLESPPASRPASPNEPRSRPGFVPGTTKCSPQDSILLSIDMVPFYLDEALVSLGLHVEARTSFISYWLPSMLKYKFIALRFLPQIDYEASAPLEINPRPDVVTRVYMLFQGVAQEELDGWQEAQERLSEGVDIWKAVVGVEESRQNNKDLFRVLEWGGMEVF